MRIIMYVNICCFKYEKRADVLSFCRAPFFDGGAIYNRYLGKLDRVTAIFLAEIFWSWLRFFGVIYYLVRMYLRYMLTPHFYARRWGGKTSLSFDIFFRVYRRTYTRYCFFRDLLSSPVGSVAPGLLLAQDPIQRE